jgi:Family of unknown function (DUF6178)
MSEDQTPASKRPALTVHDQAELVLRLPAAQRWEFLLEAPKPMALVRALPDGDFYLTIREVEPLEALPLLQLASAGQITHLLDLEAWRADRFDPLRCGAWVALLTECDEATLRRFVRNADDEMLVLLFRDWAHVSALAIDHEEPTRGHGLTEEGDERGFVSPDGGYLFSPERAEHAAAVRRLAESLFLGDTSRYSGLVWAALHELPSELEERALRWRTSRLEEHGYPPLDEALEVYTPPAREPAPPVDPPHDITAPRTALRVLGPRELIVRAVEALPAAERERVLFGLTALANRLLVADAADPGAVETHALAIARGASYAGIALEARGAWDDAAAARVLSEVRAVDLFREGYDRAAELGRRARRMLAHGFGAGHAKALDLLDGPLRLRFAALLAPRPRYVEVDEDGATRQRDFRRLTEIGETVLTLDLVEALARLLIEGTGTTAVTLLDAERGAFEDAPRLSTLLLTMLAWHAARGERRIDPLPADVVADFLRTTASRRTAAPDAPARAMDALVDALAEDAGLDRRLSASVRAFGTSALERLAADCGNLDPGVPVTRRVVGCLRL